ncbi:MAG: replication initiation factor domain-containing protein [Delftia acidovorans]|nr:replication initiation factor domain-containing protein [Delftia acidovorans]
MTLATLHSPSSARGASWRLRPAGAAAPSARAVTRVESSSTTSTSESSATRAAKIDWLNATFDQPAMSVHGLISFVGQLMGRPLTAELDGGLFGFTERHRVTARLDDGAKVEIGSIALGGESQKGRWLLQLNGKGCGLVTDWTSLQELLEGLDATISRVDLAVDFLDGEYTVDDALTLWDQGAFINRGRNPELDTQGAWHESGTKGRTMYVGKLKNGKTLCVYEKGRQLNMPDSDWTRYEVRLGNRDRVIPLDVLTNPDKYFTGAYPALAHMLEAAAEEIPTVREEVKGSLAHGLHHAQRCYGKYFHQAMEATGCNAFDLVEEVRVIGIPRKVEPSGVVAGLAWPELQAQMERLKS